MRALRVVHLVESLDLGGIERIVVNLVRRAGAAVRVEVVCAARGGELLDEIEASGVRTRVLGLASYYPGAILRTALALRALRPDLVHSHGHFAGVLGRAAAWCGRAPRVIHHVHTIDTTLAPRHLRLERALARLTSMAVCCSRAVEEHARADLGLPGSRTLTVPNGIEPPPPVGAEQARALLDHPRGPVIGCVGSLAPHKGQATLLQALSLLPSDLGPGTLVLVGDGEERRRLAALAGRCARSWGVRFLGRRGDARRLLPALDLAVVPSLGREGFSLSAVEAMDASIPVVASRIGGLPEVVEDGRTGLLVAPGDPEALAWGMATVLRRPDRGRAFGLAGRARVERLFRAEAMARRIASLYEEVLGDGRAA
ncbi:MAG: glycosyltransferase [Acidobacteriota bacterium]